jgi:DUF1680 family protein
MRTLASWHHYLATSSEHGLQLHQYGAAQVTGGGLSVRVRTEYPWQGEIEVVVESAPDASREMALRIPGWAREATLHVEGEPVAVVAGEYARITRTWRPGDVVRLVLPMAPRLTRGHHRVDAVRGAVAIERGPLVYAIEHLDQEGVAVDDAALTSTELTEQWRGDLFGGIPVVTAPARNLPDGDAGRVVAIPYFMWANRDIGPMKVWLPMDG